MSVFGVSWGKLVSATFSSCEGVTWGHFLLPPLLSGNTITVQEQRRVQWPVCYFEADIWIGAGSVVISASCTKISVTLGMSSAAVERQYYGLGKALGNILLQSQHTQGCGRGELGSTGLSGNPSHWGIWPPVSDCSAFPQIPVYNGISHHRLPGLAAVQDEVCDIPTGRLFSRNAGANLDPKPREAPLLANSRLQRVTTLQGELSTAVILFTSSWGGVGRAAVSRTRKVGARFLHCPLHLGAHGMWSCAQPLSHGQAVLPPQSEGRSCTSVKRVRTFYWVTASTHGNLDQKKMMGVWW